MKDFKNWFYEEFDFSESLRLKGDFRGGIYQRLVAARYMLAPAKEQDAVPAFLDLGKKIARQKEFLDTKYEMVPTQDDPYPSMKAMSASIQRQKKAGVKRPKIATYAEPPQLAGEKGGGHPIFSNEENVVQRYVHDVIAHYFGKHKFTARGEYGAYNRHLKTLCNLQQVQAGECLAAKAMFTEVVGQISCYYVYGTYVDQKAVILEDFDHANVGLLAKDSPLNRFFEVAGKTMIKKFDFTSEEFEAFDSELFRELIRQTTGNPKVPLVPIFREEEPTI